MKFGKFGKVFLIGGLSVGVIFGFAFCVESKTTGYLYVMGTAASQSSGNGFIAGYQIDQNTGALTSISGLPAFSGGANPVRAVLTSSSRFIYVLNRGADAEGNANCTTADPCQSANITEFAVSGNGTVTLQKAYSSQGNNPFRIIADTTGNYLLVLDHDAPDNYNTTYNPSTNACTLALGSGVQTCGDITVFHIDSTTGNLSLVANAQVSSGSGGNLNYFPVPANPVDFVLSGGFILTLTGAPTPTSFPYTGGTAVWPYSYATTNGQLTLSQDSAQQLGIHQGNVIASAGGVVYVLDNEPITVTFNGASTTSLSQILPFTVASDGTLQAEPSGIIPDDSTLSNPVQIMLESKGRFVYVANQGEGTGPNAESGIAGYFLTTTPSYQLSFIAGEPFGPLSGPQCIVEDPSDHYFYTANSYSSDVTGYEIDQNSGVLRALQGAGTPNPLQGPATWCLIDGRTE